MAVSQLCSELSGRWIRQPRALGRSPSPVHGSHVTSDRTGASRTQLTQQRWHLSLMKTGLKSQNLQTKMFFPLQLPGYVHASSIGKRERYVWVMLANMWCRPLGGSSTLRKFERQEEETQCHDAENPASLGSTLGNSLCQWPLLGSTHLTSRRLPNSFLWLGL